MTINIRDLKIIIVKKKLVIHSSDGIVDKEKKNKNDVYFLLKITALYGFRAHGVCPTL